MTATIAAVASPPGSGRRAVVRISGPRARAIVREACRSGDEPPRLDERSAVEAVFLDGHGGLPCLILWMPGPRSFTAEDVAELHVLGHPEIVDGVLERLFALGAEHAAPGEFTRRAFENGRIDLTRAEGVLALVHSRSEGERRAATALLVGGLERRIRGIREALESVRSLAEASLDFDEADTGHVPTEVLLVGMSDARRGIEEALGWERTRVARGGRARVVLAGEPNAGKSTLFNRLASGAVREASGAALVSDLAGTTRDAKRAEWALGDDLVVELFDTAGRTGWDRARAGAEEDDDPDALAEAAAAALVEAADLVLWVVDGSSQAEPGPPPAEPARVLLAWNKVDRGDAAPAGSAGGGLVSVPVSAALGTGLTDLERAVRSRLLGEGSGAAVGAGPGASGRAGLGARHAAALEAALGSLDEAQAGTGAGAPLDAIAEALRAATDALDAIVGRTTPEDLLDRIFAQFCLGK